MNILDKISSILLGVLRWIIVSLLILVVLLLIITQTDFGKQQIVKFAQQIANKSLNAQLHIGKLEGNFLNSITLKDILLKQNKDTVISIDKLKLNYNLIELIDNRITLNQIKIYNPKVFIHQFPDSTWNIQHLIKTDTVQKDTTSSTFLGVVTVHELDIKNGVVAIHTIDSIYPQRIKDLNINLSAIYNKKNQHINISNFKLKTIQPDFNIAAFTAKVDNNDEQIMFELFLKTKLNIVKLNGNYFYDNNRKSTIELTTKPINFIEFTHWIPTDYLLTIKPELKIKTEIENKEINSTLLLSWVNQQIIMKFYSEKLVQRILLKNIEVLPDYALDIELSKLKVSDWLNDKSYNHVINGYIKTLAEGSDIQDIKANIEAKLYNSIIAGVPLKRMNTNINFQNGNSSGNIILQGNFGSVVLKPRTYNTTSKNISYNVEIKTKHLNIAPFIGPNYQSDINLNLKTQGVGYEPKSMKLQNTISMSSSKVMSFEIDSLYANINYIKQNIDLKRFFIKTLSSDLSISGNFHQRDTSNIEALLKIRDAHEIANLMGIDSANTSGTLIAKLYGMPNHLKADLIFKLDSSYYKSIKFNSILLNANAQINNKEKMIDATSVLHQLDMAGYLIDSINLKAKTDLLKHQITINLANNDIQTKIQSNVQIAKNIRIDLDTFNVSYKNYAWRLKPDSTNLEINSTNYTINNFTLQSDNKDATQTISLYGTYSTNSDENLTLSLKDIYLPQIYSLFNADNKLDGRASFSFNLNGTARNPIIDAHYQFNNLSFDNYPLEKFKGYLSYSNNSIETQSSLAALDSAQIRFQAKLPLALRLDSFLIDTESYKNEPQWGQLSMDSVPISIAKIFYPFDKIDGVANTNLTLGGTPANPKLDGKFNIKNGNIKISNLGIDYHNINTNVLFENRSLILDTLYMNSKKGKITGNGNILFASTLMEAKMDNANINLGFKHFRPFDHRQFNMEVDGNLNLKANNDSTRFSGDLTIPETMIYLPAIFKLMKKNSLPEIPKSLLAAQLAKDSLLLSLPNNSELNYDSQVLPKDALTLPAYLSNLQGKIKIKIPRNMWIKNDEMRLELSGDIELIKNLNFFEIFGDINVVRGQYDLLGKIFIIKTGTITFEGGEEMNPKLDMEAHYNFRDSERESHTIKLLIGGNMYEPEFKFKYDDQDISEGDAISYIVFGASLSALGEIESQSSSAGDLAKMAAASLLSSQLTKLLGNTLNMDFVEYRNSSSFDNASLTVGKYLTNKLFISYEQNIGKLENDDTDRYNLRLEYELMKYLFFELNSSSRSNGLDLIFKLDENNNPFVKNKKNK